MRRGFVLRLASAALIVLGSLTSLAGLVFALQGLGLVGPSYSFMYNSGQWVYEGSVTFLVGVASFAGGLLLKMRRSSQTPSGL